MNKDRPLKFRFYDKKDKKMRYFELNEILERHMSYYGDFDYKALKYNKMQYTGLKDKNGVEIYEGDIIKTYANHGYGKNIKQVEVISEVIYKVDEEKTMGGLNSNSFSGFKTKQLNNQEYTNVDWSMFFQCEVIGNIYEELKDSDD